MGDTSRQNGRLRVRLNQKRWNKHSVTLVEVAMLRTRSKQSHLRLVHSADVSFTIGVDTPKTDRPRFRIIEGGCRGRAGTDERARLATHLPREIGQ